ncbi:MAG: glycosyltransferase, exosortase A system-associated [Alphaproteobacteria bacterium]|nr:glycosyltransferase, exosortase A system-associated [Alphaproteobacteria bacterium]
MRVLHILDHSLPAQSGYVTRTNAILNQQRALGWETIQLTSPRQPAQAKAQAQDQNKASDTGPDEIDSLSFYRTPPIKGLWRTPWIKELADMARLSRRIRDVVEDTRPDLIHAHSPVLNALAAYRAGTGLPIVYEIRAFWEDAGVDLGRQRAWGPRYRAIRMLETRASKRADAVVTICEGLRSDLEDRGIGQKEIFVVPNAVEADRFPFQASPDQALAAELGVSGKTVIGFIGSFYAYEGLVTAIEALRSLAAQFPDLHLLLVGGGPREAELRALTLQLGLEGRVHFTGRVPAAEVPRYYSLIDLAIFPRLPMRLTDLVTPLKPLEAMAMGKLVVASDVGGHKELIDHNATGYLFPAGSAEALAQAITTALDQREAWPGILQAGRAFAETERSWPVVAQVYQRVYDHAMEAVAAKRR